MLLVKLVARHASNDNKLPDRALCRQHVGTFHDGMKGMAEVQCVAQPT